MKDLREKPRKTKVNIPKTQKALEAHWDRLATFYEGPQSLEALSKSMPLTAAETRLLIGRGKKKPISVRLPELDIDALKRLAKISQSKYQRLIVTAIEKYIDEEEEKLFREKRPMKKAI